VCATREQNVGSNRYFFHYERQSAINQEVTLELSAKHLSPESINADTVPADIKIQLPDGFELVSGDLSWSGNIPKQDTVRISAKVKAVKTGTYTIHGVAYLGEGLTKNLVVTVTNDISTSKVISEEYVKWQEP